MFVQPYLFFDGRCEEALDFYKKALGAKVEMMLRFKDNPEPPKGDSACGPVPDDKVMHTSFRIGETVVMASDGQCSGKTSFQGFGLTLNAADAKEADRVFNALADGGQVQMPLAKTFFSPCFGMVADRFGIMWMVLTTPKA